MPREKLYSSNAERQAAYNERKRKEREEAAQAEAREQNRIRSIQRRTEYDIAEMLDRMSHTFVLQGGDYQQTAHVAKQHVREIARRIRRW